MWSIVAQAHVDHWVGGHGADGWGTVVAPWGTRLWSAVMIIAVSGWSASAERLARQNFPAQFVAALLGITVCILVAMPGALWISRIGHIGDGLMLMALVWGALPVLCAGVTGVVIAYFFGWRFGTLAGLGVGGSVLWLTSGWI
jgi:hypothetical protein